MNEPPMKLWIGQLYEVESVGLLYNELLEKCDQVFQDLKITDTQC